MCDLHSFVMMEANLLILVPGVHQPTFVVSRVICRTTTKVVNVRRP